MTSLKLVVLLVCVVHVICQVSEQCPTTPCQEPNGCCLRLRRHYPAQCSPFLPLNARCRRLNVQENNVYLRDCPCEPALFCTRHRCRTYSRSHAPGFSPNGTVHDDWPETELGSTTLTSIPSE